MSAYRLQIDRREPPRHSYRFCWAGPGGPGFRLFSCPHDFDDYVRTWRDSWGPVEWLSPFVARGAL